MKTRMLTEVLVFILALVVGQGQAAPMGTEFTYQGRLIDANDAADGEYDFEFKLYDDPTAGTQQGSMIYASEVDVIDGYFTVGLDFGSDVFDGDVRWLQIGVRPGEMNDPNVYTTLQPRQEVTPTPYALYAKTAQTTGSDNDWMVTGDDMYSIPSGNVGIGTTSPEKKLDIVSESYADLGIALSTKSIGGTSWDIENDEGVFKIVEHASCGPEYLNNTRIAVVGNCIGSPHGGNVGIGTESPQEILDVNGAINTDSVYKIGTNTVLSTLGLGNIFVGVGAGPINIGHYNTFIGSWAGYYNTEGDDNTFVGRSAGYFNTTGNYNTFLGHEAGYSNTTGDDNTFLGCKTGCVNTTGYYNTSLGYKAGRSNTTGNDNTFLGVGTGYSNTTGGDNTFVGERTGYSNTTGFTNTFIGRDTGHKNTTGSSNTFLGCEAGYCNSEGTGNVFVGYKAGFYEYGSNKLYIANGPADANTLIYGDFSTGNVGIGTTTPLQKLHIAGSGMTSIFVHETNNNVIAQLQADSSSVAVQSIYNHPLRFVINDIERVKIDTSGNVGIGADEPAYNLDVIGDIRATGSVYYGGTEGNSNGTAYNKPDYVFEEDYDIMSTEQVEQYLKKENHLPWMTSTKQEKEENGDVIDMTRMAFETVETAENLQMQIIELNKLIKEQAVLIKAQQKKVAALEMAIQN